MCVGDYIACCFRGHRFVITSRHTHLIHTITDVCSTCFLIQFAPRMAPVVCFIQCYRFSFCGPIGFQLYRDFLRSDSILVVCIIPDFSYTYTCLLRCIRIRQCCYRPVYACVCQTVPFRHLAFNPPVLNRRPILIYRQISYCCCPVVFCIQLYRPYRGVSIHQADTQLLRTFSILVVCIIPDFSYTYACRLRFPFISNANGTMIRIDIIFQIFGPIFTNTKVMWFIIVLITIRCRCLFQIVFFPRMKSPTILSITLDKANSILICRKAVCYHFPFVSRIDLQMI